MIEYCRYKSVKGRIQMSQNNKNVKKTLIIVLSVLAAVLLVMYLLTLALPSLFNAISGENTEEGTADFNFYEPDFNENIYEDDRYLELIADGVLRYDNGSNSIVAITPDNVASFGDPIKLLYNLVYAAIEGDNERYNSFFSSEYLKAHGAKGEFTMQKIYGGTITAYSTEGVQGNNGNYTKYIYMLNYRILDNNGTFRADIGEDSKTQYIVITDREGKLLIDAISTSRYK